MLKSILICLLFWGSSFTAASAEDTSYAEFVKKFYDSINRHDFENIYRYMATSRFQVSSDFDSFQKAMLKIIQELGGIKDYRESYKFEDNRFNGFVFFRLQYQVQHEKGDSQERIVVMKKDGKFFVDGYAVYSAGQFWLAQGNLHWFNAIDEQIARVNPALAEAWATLKDQSVAKDSFNKEGYPDQGTHNLIKINRNGN